jgi:hypothetical protein
MCVKVLAPTENSYFGDLMRLRTRAMSAISVGLFLVVGLQPSVATAATGPWEIGIYDFPKCLEVEGGSTNNSAQVQLWSCDGSQLHRVWYMREVATGWWHIYNAKSGKCLNVQGASTNNSAKIIQYTCQSTSAYNDQWQLLKTGWVGTNGDLYVITNRKSGKSLNAQGASSANGTDLIQYTCGADWNNLFTWWPAA